MPRNHAHPRRQTENCKREPLAAGLNMAPDSGSTFRASHFAWRYNLGVNAIGSILIVLLVMAGPLFADAPSAASSRKATADARALLDKNNAATPPTMSIEIGRPRRVEATLAFAASAPRITPRKWTIIAPMPPVLASQREIAAETTPLAKTSAESAGLKRPILLWNIAAEDPPKRQLALGIRYTLELLPRALVARAPAADSVAALTADERAAFTLPGRLTDFETPVFQAWLAEHALRPSGKETDLDFARRVFLEIKDGGGFEFNEQMDRRASVVCKGMKSDCGGLTALFVATLRANGIPARQLVGRWAETAEKDEKLDGKEWQKEHVKAEFYAAGIGWVPVDMSVAVDIDRRPGSLRHFGRDNADFIAMHIEPDISLEIEQLGKRSMQFLQAPVFFVTGQGSMERATSKSDWHVTPLPPPAKPPR